MQRQANGPSEVGGCTSTERDEDEACISKTVRDH